MDAKDTFHTLKGYQLLDDSRLTPAMEDYLEMICRLLLNCRSVRMTDLSAQLHVRPSSASKMVQQLARLGYLCAQRYGTVTLTEKGETTGNYLLYRHRVLHRFLCYVNNSGNELKETERIEHFLSPRTVGNLDLLLARITGQNDPGGQASQP